MNWFLLSLFFPLIFGSYVYNVKVDLAENLPDEDPDAPTIFGYQAWENKNDPYIQIFAYGSGGDDKLKVEKTKIIESADEPEWNEEFQFNDADSNGPYLKFLFKAWDDDSTFGSDAVNDPDYLGETREIQVAEITDCDSDFEFRLPVSRDGKECGLLVVELSKDGCDDSYNTDDDGYDGSTTCCDSDEVARVEASGACREGCACCPDGSYVGSIGDARTFPCDNGNNELVIGQDEFGQLCEVDEESEETSEAYTQTEKSGKAKGSKSAAYAGYEQVDGDCLVGDIVYVNGQSIGVIGDLCNDDSTTTYVGTQSFCRNGEVVEEGYDGDCDTEYPGSTCCQEGEPGTFGAAVCITRECVPYDGGYVGTSVPDDGDDCLVGDIMYTNGQVIGILGDTCNDDGSYIGRKSICVDGKVVDEDYVGDCDEEYEGSSCCQFGPPGTIGAAVCQRDVECNEYDGGSGGPLPSDDGSCLVGDIMYLNGDSTGFIGYTCDEETDTTFTGKEGICRDGEVVDEDYSGECGDGTICCQQGEPDTIGGAVCVTEENCVEYDEEDDDDTEEYGIEDNSEDSDIDDVCCALEDIERIEASGACREGCQCCPDGSYVGSIGDARTFTCDNGDTLVVGVDEFGEICEDDDSGDSDGYQVKEDKDKGKGGGKTKGGYRRLLKVN